jgi:hypothetical protein
VQLVLCRLGQRADHEPVDVDVLGQADGQRHALGDILSGEGAVDALVEGGCSFCVTTHPVEGELVGPDHPGRHLDHPDGLAAQLQPQGLDECPFGVAAQ